MSEEKNYKNVYEHRELEREVFFANSLGVQTSPTDFVIEFETKMPNNIINPKSVILNPMIAKELLYLLHGAVKMYENNFGEIPDSIELRNKGFEIKDEGNKDDGV
ncbi:DUF3467 domain-containing protein [Macrococcus caseolyticus]|uniref:Uncharacterized protein n=1 Tax=Macrococcoides caseolyticum TaxID=69966 RepID=A0ACC9MQM4_9STAP|nr:MULTISPECIES: DUF3467 domain-containing protein [Macrococcus]MDJ1156069.1 DUF3467 domain-containing protein [Macrococcus caseolyticus]PKE38181.1 hypothetical protein CW675_12060 [Macrococcus caseolyticus]PKE51598.1 hypothetical protein CW672_00420 [Macrococcus caseolyticus]PKE55248.1 hypothetical protein CW682_12515 [Macrococcus caseolyticus]PKE73071.1 hypothetical protein CW665_01175 [Macrococcus caseolyticus]